MGFLEVLMNGIKRIPDHEEPIFLSGEAAIARHKVEHIEVQNALREIKPQFDLVDARHRTLMLFYEVSPLGKYSAKKDAEYAEQRGNTCIPCFVQWPADQPAWIRINWGLSGNLGSSPETQYGALLKAAKDLPSPESEPFLYALRSGFLEGLKASKNYFAAYGKAPLRRPKSIDNEKDEMTGAEERFIELKSYKGATIRQMYSSIARYQFMVDLIKAKQQD